MLGRPRLTRPAKPAAGPTKAALRPTKSGKATRLAASVTAALLAAAGLALPSPAYAGAAPRSPYVSPTDNPESGRKYQVHGAEPPSPADRQRELVIATLTVRDLHDARRITADLQAPDLILVPEADNKDICYAAGTTLSCGIVGDGKADTLQELALAITRAGGPTYDAWGAPSGFLFRTDRLSPAPADEAILKAANPLQVTLFNVRATAGADEHYPLWAISGTGRAGHAAALTDAIEAARPHARVLLGGDAMGTDSGLHNAGAFLVNDALHGDLIEAREPVARFHSQAGLSVGDASVTEGSPLIFPVTLTRPLSRPLTVCAATVPGTTTLPIADYEPYLGCRTVPAGAIRADFPVQVRGDRLREGNEQLTLEVTALTAVRVVKSRGTGTITDQ